MEACALTDTGQKRSMNQILSMPAQIPSDPWKTCLLWQMAWAAIRLGISHPVLWWRIWYGFLKSRIPTGMFTVF